MEEVLHDKTFIYLVMEFVRGGELSSRIRELGRLDEATAKFYSYQIILAIQYLHDRDIVYRDLKPENVLIGEDGYIKLTDFGLAIHLSGGELTRTFCGTPEYLAPEILNREGYDYWVDWWTLGIFIYEMVCGFPPFYGKNDRNKLYKKIQTEKVLFPSKEKHNIAISKEWMNLIKSLLIKNPKERWGYKNGSKEILAHSWFSRIDADKIYKKQYKPAFLPTLTKNYESNENLDKYFSYRKRKKKNREKIIVFPPDFKVKKN